MDANKNPKDIEKCPSEWKLLVTPNEIIQALFTKNKKKFSQATDTSFTNDPLGFISSYTPGTKILQELKYN